MEKSIYKKMQESIKRHQGFTSNPLIDPITGHVIIGFGRNLSTIGINEDEAIFILEKDIQEAENDLRRYINFSDELDDVRKCVLIEMIVDMGILQFITFNPKMMEAIKSKDYILASKEMLKSEWANQFHGRANDLSYSLETGKM